MGPTPDLIDGSQIVQVQMFNVPGAGRLPCHAIFPRDYPLIEGLLSPAAATVVSINLTVDIRYGDLDPRVWPG